jgi:hypothetical protein
MLCPSCNQAMRATPGSRLWSCDDPSCPVAAVEVRVYRAEPQHVASRQGSHQTNQRSAQKEGRGPGGTDRGLVIRPSYRTPS